LYICVFLICIFYFVNKLKHTALLSVKILSECCDWHACNSDLYNSYRHCHVCLSNRTTCWILMNCYMNVMPLKTILNSFFLISGFSDNNLAEAPTCGVGMPLMSLLKCCFHNNHCNDSNTSNKFHSLTEFTSMIKNYPQLFFYVLLFMNSYNCIIFLHSFHASQYACVTVSLVSQSLRVKGLVSWCGWAFWAFCIGWTCPAILTHPSPCIYTHTHTHTLVWVDRLFPYWADKLQWI